MAEIGRAAVISSSNLSSSHHRYKNCNQGTHSREEVERDRDSMKRARQTGFKAPPAHPPSPVVHPSRGLLATTILYSVSTLPLPLPLTPSARPLLTISHTRSTSSLFQPASLVNTRNAAASKPSSIAISHILPTLRILSPSPSLGPTGSRYTVVRTSTKPAALNNSSRRCSTPHTAPVYSVASRTASASLCTSPPAARAVVA